MTNYEKSILEKSIFEISPILKNSVFEKMQNLKGFKGAIGKLGNFLTTGKLIGYLSIFIILI
jgi:hypothetical protein